MTIMDEFAEIESGAKKLQVLIDEFEGAKHLEVKCECNEPENN